MRRTGTRARAPRKGAPRAGRAIAGVLLAVALLGAGGLLLPRPHPGGGGIGGPFVLTDGAGRVVTERDFAGKYLLVYFGYTTCPDVCPTTLAEMADAMGRLGTAAARVQPLFITLDPARDTSAVMRDYASAFGAGIVGLTGTQAQVDQVAREYRLYHAVRRTGPDAGDYTVDHASVLYLMEPGGALLAPLRADEPGPALAADIARYLG